MEQQAGSDKVTVLFMLGILGFAVVLVDDRWMRTGLALLPALLLAQRALMGVGVAVGQERRALASRRADRGTREHIEDLLKHFREFYTTCHLMATGSLAPAEAKDLAAGIERRLNQLLAEVTDAARSAGVDR